MDKLLSILKKDYGKYRWFFTSSNKLVIGGKSAEQNEALLNLIKKERLEVTLMHTSSPGSPFSLILSENANISKTDVKECAIFTACFSKAWKEGAKKADVEVFSSSNIYKKSFMKQGTWGVQGIRKKINAYLRLVLIMQKNALRAVPYIISEKMKNLKIKGKSIFISPGAIKKEDMLQKLEIELGKNLSKEEVFSALPSGSFKIIRE